MALITGIPNFVSGSGATKLYEDINNAFKAIIQQIGGTAPDGNFYQGNLSAVNFYQSDSVFAGFLPEVEYEPYSYFIISGSCPTSVIGGTAPNIINQIWFGPTSYDYEMLSGVVQAGRKDTTTSQGGTVRLYINSFPVSDLFFSTNTGGTSPTYGDQLFCGIGFPVKAGDFVYFDFSNLINLGQGTITAKTILFSVMCRSIHYGFGGV